LTLLFSEDAHLETPFQRPPRASLHRHGYLSGRESHGGSSRARPFRGMGGRVRVQGVRAAPCLTLQQINVQHRRSAAGTGLRRSLGRHGCVIVVTSLPIRIDRSEVWLRLPKVDKPGGEGMMSKAKPATEPASASQNRAADDSERVPNQGSDWLFLLVSAGVAALLAIGTSLVSTFAGNTFWPYLAGAACAVVAFLLLFLGFLRLRGSIRDAVAGSFLLGYLWLLSQLLFLPGLRDGLLQNPSGQLVFQQFTVIVGIVVAFYFVASGAVNVAAKLANTRSKEIPDAESKYEAFKPVELGEREYLARREAAKQS